MGSLVAAGLQWAGAIGPTAAAAATAAAWANLAIAVTATAYAQNQARKQAASASDMASRGRPFNIGLTDTPRSLIVGRTSVPIERIVYMDTFGERRERVVFVAAFGGHEIDAIEDITIDGESIGALDSEGWVTGGKFARKKTRAHAFEVIWPAPGVAIDLPFRRATATDPSNLNTYNVVSVAEWSNADEAPRNLPVGAGGYVFAAYPDPSTSDPLDSKPVVVAGNNSGAYTGKRVTITCHTEETKPLIRAVKFLGVESGETDEELMALSADSETPWTLYHTGNGVPRVKFELIWDADTFSSMGGIGIISGLRFIVRGAKCYDFATSQTTWTRNSARIAAWFLGRPEGFNATSDDIDATLALAAQNACAESVAYGDGSQTQARYNCDGLIDPTENPRENLRSLVGSMAGMAVPVGRGWDLYAGVPSTPTYTLTDDDLAGGEELFQPVAAIGEMTNSVRGRYVDATAGYILRDAVPYSSSTYVSEDGGVKKWLAVDLPFTTDPYAAQRIQRLNLHIARNSAVWSTRYKLGAYPVRGGMTIRCQHTQYGWEELESGAGKRFVVLERGLHPSGEIDLVAQEIGAAYFDWDYDEATAPDPTPNTTFADPTYVAPVRNIAAYSDANTVDIASDGGVVPYVLLRWEALPDAAAREAQHIVIGWKYSPELSWREERLLPTESETKLRPVWGGLHIDGYIYVVNSLGVRSAQVPFVHHASEDLPGNTQTISANRLANATLEGRNGFEPPSWRLNIEAGTTDEMRLYKPNPIGGSGIHAAPSNAMISQGGSGQWKHCIATPRKYQSAIPGRRYVAMVGVIPFRCECTLRIVWLMADGSVMQTDWATYTDGRNGLPFVGSTLHQANPGALGDYQPLVAEGIAPVGAQQAAWELIKWGTTPGASLLNSGVYFAKPFFGEVAGPGIPEWDSGGIGISDTDSADPGAWTEIFTPPASNLDNDGLPWVSREVCRFTPSHDGQIEVTIRANFRSQATSSTGYVLVARIAGENAIVKPGESQMSSAWQEIYTVPGNSVQVGTAPIVATFDVTAGVPVVLHLYMGRSDVVTSVTAGGNVSVAPKSISIPSGRDKAFQIAPRTTYVKR